MNRQRNRLALQGFPDTSNAARGMATMMTPSEPTSPNQPASPSDAATIAMHYEQENARLARLIHDGPAQQLTAAMIELSLWKSDVESGQPVSPEALQNLSEVLQSASNEMRNVNNSLRPRSLDLFGLAAAIESIAKRHGNCRFRAEAESFQIRPELAIQIVRVVESIVESIDRATSFEMELVKSREEIVLRINGLSQIELQPHVAGRLTAFNGHVEKLPGSVEIRFVVPKN